MNDVMHSFVEFSQYAKDQGISLEQIIQAIKDEEEPEEGRAYELGEEWK